VELERVADMNFMLMEMEKFISLVIFDAKNIKNKFFFSFITKRKN
jgi:hypothetical protein